ncbi:Holliday junction DNA helicase subunit RuvA [Solimonas aquatica]|uniref:Holliday junction branch migration complex subunit RuvA n=1 Tax=Solimonas aquatica TaxID=489703 RepID=A0A1H9HGJ4_9GAMM|nr:Holliday junction branch migration protein RuvA [Solimonas aquatica]SEQ61404.1 Holliday junction DNA helicase subunit RuvA [Solimonas aquatica]
MIGRISGRLLVKQPPALLVDVSGVGYEIEAPMSTFYKLPALGETVTLHTHLTVREDAHLLFGFASLTEKNLFRELIKISGVGPKLALTVLSGVSVEEFWNTVRAGDVARLTKLPGVGRKTAERLVVEMRDKAGSVGEVPGVSLPAAGPGGALAEARSALAALGYKPAEIGRFTEAVYKEGMSTEQIIQEALRRAVR